MSGTTCRWTRRAAIVGAALVAMLAPPRVALTQQPDTLPVAPDALPPIVAREAAARYNAPAALRATSATTIDSSRVIDGDVVTLEAPLVIAGMVRGNVTAINANVTLRPGARVDGEIFVVGGAVTGLEAARVGGEVRAWQAPLRYMRQDEGASIVVAEPTGSESLLAWVRYHERRPSENGLRITNRTTYNRVEGLPIYAGPYITRHVGRGTVTAELFGILRSADNFAWTSENVGHSATLEARTRGPVQLVAGGKLQDVVEAIEPWQISNSEAALGTFVLHRDLRDWYSREGGTVYLGIAAPRNAGLTLSYGDERWASRRARDPWTLFRDGQRWRPNPTIDDGRFHTLRLTGTVDTRNDARDPRVGWYAQLELEHGQGDLTSFGARSWGSNVCNAPSPCVFLASNPPARDRYSRGFLDLRRYNRLSPETQLNARVVLAGWLGGDELPLERQLSLGGLGTLPGYDFRKRADAIDRLSCEGAYRVPGTPAECERIALGQLEYRVDLGLERIATRLIPGWYATGAALVFVDAGRGWRIDHGDDVGLRGSQFPSLDSFQSDVGAGLDLSFAGVYIAKAVSVAHEPPNVFVRLKHRF